MLKVIVKTEKIHKVQQRWSVGEEKFNSAALCVIQETRNRAIGKIYAIAVERMFLLSLKRKYAGTCCYFVVSDCCTDVFIVMYCNVALLHQNYSDS